MQKLSVDDFVKKVNDDAVLESLLAASSISHEEADSYAREFYGAFKENKVTVSDVRLLVFEYLGQKTGHSFSFGY